MQVEIVSNPDFGHLEVAIGAGEQIICESGAMAAMDADVQLATRMMGGFLPALWRKFVAGESLMCGVYSCPLPSCVAPTVSSSAPGLGAGEGCSPVKARSS